MVSGGVAAVRVCLAGAWDGRREQVGVARFVRREEELGFEAFQF